MTNNKSGDSLKKQEENGWCAECGETENIKISRAEQIRLGATDGRCFKCVNKNTNTCSTPKVATSEKCKRHNINLCDECFADDYATSERKEKVIKAAEDFADRFEPVMKELAEGGEIDPTHGATSEKENKYRSPRQIGCNHSHTPHESEDWSEEAELAYNSVSRTKLREYTDKLEAKAYQRGREEGYTEGIEKCAFDEVEIEKSSLSLAVQEIGKAIDDIHRKQAGSSEFQAGKIQGLEKAKEIISGLKSKE